MYVIEKYNIDYIVHGDDPCLVDGKDVYESAQKLGKYLTIPRTEGISTTDIVGRMLLMTKSHHSGMFTPRYSSRFMLTSLTLLTIGSFSDPERLSFSMEKSTSTMFDRKTNFLTTSRTIKMFGAGMKNPSKHAKIVYLAGSWDMFHAGHVAILKVS